MCVYIYISYIYISLSLSLSVWWLVISDDQKDRYLLSWQGYGAPKCHLGYVSHCLEPDRASRLIWVVQAARALATGAEGKSKECR